MCPPGNNEEIARMAEDLLWVNTLCDLSDLCVKENVAAIAR